MAHLKKNTPGAVPGLAVHFERKTDHHTNKEIDVAKTYLNQELMADGSDMLSQFNGLKSIFETGFKRHLSQSLRSHQ